MMSLSLDNEVVASFAWYGTLVLLKLLTMGIVTSWYRLLYGVFSNNEDAKFAKIKNVQIHPKVERARRAHLNDMENIFPFFLIGILYVMTDPALYYASLHFKVFFIARVAHGVIYVGEIPQPARVTCHVVGLSVMLSMAYQVLTHL